MFDSLFEFFFKYRPLVFSQGELVWRTSSALFLVVGTIALAAGLTLVTYQAVRGDSRTRDRIVLTTMRLGALALLLLCLLRPVLILKAAVPQQNFVGVLIDDSRSMRIADRDEGDPRSSFVQEQLGAPESPLLSALSNRFVVRTFRFSRSTERVAGAKDMTFNGTQTRLGEALRRAQDELAGLPLAGLVMVSDGADTAEAALGESLLALKANATPVFTVGVGSEALARDIQVSRVSTPRSVLKGSSLVVDVIVAATGYEGTTVPLQVEDEGRIVSTQDVRLPRDGEPMTVRVKFTAGEAGARAFRFRVPPPQGEPIPQNNVREALIEVEDRREKILYFEGEPRFEVKFIRRAIEDDKNLELVVLQRTAETKFMRFGLDNPEELVSGFPKTREELFAYRGLILGSIEAGAFTAEQLRMIADFVNRRGGGLLMLGGRRAFGEGGYAGTPLDDVLPVVFESGGNKAGATPFLARLQVHTTRAGASHPVTQIGKTEQESSEKWNGLPGVTSVNPIGRLKPGATMLLAGNDGRRDDLVVLASQRYGRGKALVFPIQDSWNWQLSEKVPLEDMSHEIFWRQLLRWLVEGVPEKVTSSVSVERVEPGEPVTLTADVADASFVEVNDGKVTAHVTAPSGKAVDLPLNWNAQRDGEYRATFVPDEEGRYQVKIQAARGDAAIGADVSYLRAGPGDEEYFDAGMRPQLLKRIAEETGGRFYTAQNVSSLAEDVSHTGRGVTITEERDLWDMPALLFLMVGLVLGEWSYRRARGLV